MCFGGGGGQQQQAPAPINIMPQAPIVKTPEAPKQLTNTFKPLQSPEYQPGIQQAGSSSKRRLGGGDRVAMARRRGLGIGVSGSGVNFPTGGINL